VPAHPPDWLVGAVAARGVWPGIPRLVGVTEVPALRADGTVVEAPGYDQASGILHVPSVVVPPVAARPTREEAAAAAAALLDVVGEFPFARPEHASAWLAIVLTTLARHAFDGPVPLFLLDGNTRGVGKSLLADVAATIVTGRPISRTPPTDDASEERKRLTAIVIAGDQVVLIDNVTTQLGSPALDSWLTGRRWTDRVLGLSAKVDLPITAVLLASGNNVVLAGDMIRRCAHVRLDSPEEAPDRRRGFRHADLLAHVRESRARLVWAALTVLRGHAAAGRPDQGLEAWGSFEGWSAIVRNAIAWVGLPDPGLTREQLREDADREIDSLRAFLMGLEGVTAACGGAFTVGRLVAELSGPRMMSYGGLRSAVAELCPTNSGGLPSPERLGKLLQKYRGRVVGQFVIQRGVAKGTWIVRRLG
jgi:hypothetical protein